MLVFKNPCNPVDKSYLIKVYNPFNILLIPFISILLRISASVYISDIDMYFFYGLVLVSGKWWPHRTGMELFLSLKFFERVSEGLLLPLF